MINLCERYGDHRDLHSFPTRRSSDLKIGVLPRILAGWSSLTAASCEAPGMASSRMWGRLSNPYRLDRRSDLDGRTPLPLIHGRQASGLPKQARGDGARRSEEHT